jgi:hypothetical protein
MDPVAPYSRERARRAIDASDADKIRALEQVDFESAPDFEEAVPARGLTNNGAKGSYREKRAERCLHAICYEDGTTKVHIDEYNPAEYPLAHALVDATTDTVCFAIFVAIWVVKTAN